MPRKRPRRKTPYELYRGLLHVRDLSAIWDGIYLAEYLGLDWRRHWTMRSFADAQGMDFFPAEKAAAWLVFLGMNPQLLEEEGAFEVVCSAARRLSTVVGEDPDLMDRILASDWTAEANL